MQFKIILITLNMLIIVTCSIAQNSVGIGTSTPDASFMLHILGQAAKSGLLIESANANAGLTVNQTGSGNGLKIIKSAVSSGQALNIEHQGSGDAVYVSKTSAGGSAVNIWVSNSANEASALFSGTTAPNGYGIGAGNFGNGVGFAIWGGGMRITQLNLTSGTTIANRAVSYQINGGGPYSFGFIPGTGELFYVYNNTLSPVVVAGFSIPANSGKTLIVMDGVLRAF